MGGVVGRRFQSPLICWLLLSGCAVQTSQMVDGHQQRAAAINARYDAAREDEIRQAETTLTTINNLLQYRLALVPGGATPLQRVDETEPFLVSRQHCDGLERRAQEAERTGSRERTTLRSQADECGKSHVNRYVDALAVAYPHAVAAWVLEEMRKGTADMEILFYTSNNRAVIEHNSKIDAQVLLGRGQVEAIRDRGLARIEDMRQRELSSSQAQMESEINLAVEQRRRAWSAVAAGLQAAGNSYHPPPAEPFAVDPPFKTPPPVAACTSDYACMYGSRCVKQNFANEGVCMKVVNDFSVPTFAPPNPRSVGPKLPSRSDCHFDPQCPPSFRCDTGSGTCVKR